MPAASDAARFPALAAVPLLLLLPDAALGAQLRGETVTAWENYVAGVKAVNESRAAAERLFLWTDESAPRLAQVRAGEIPAAPVAVIEVAGGGLIHHWRGAAFLAGVTAQDVRLVVDHYDGYASFFRPTVVASRLVRHEGNRWWHTMRWRRQTLFVTAVVDTQWETALQWAGSRRWYALSHSTQVREVKNAAGPHETLLPEGTGSGYIWKAFGLSRYEERDGGVYIEMESLVLSRDIPAALRWLVEPVVRSLGRSAIVNSLTQVRQAVLRSAERQPLSACPAIGERLALWSQHEPPPVSGRLLRPVPGRGGSRRRDGSGAGSADLAAPRCTVASLAVGVRPAPASLHDGDGGTGGRAARLPARLVDRPPG